MYRQVKVRSGSSVMTTWIPERWAKAGEELRIRDADGVWTEGWVVEEVYETRVNEDEMRERSRDHLHQREASDI